MTQNNSKYHQGPRRRRPNPPFRPRNVRRFFPRLKSANCNNTTTAYFTYFTQKTALFDSFKKEIAFKTILAKKCQPLKYNKRKPNCWLKMPFTSITKIAKDKPKDSSQKQSNPYPKSATNWRTILHRKAHPSHSAKNCATIGELDCSCTSVMSPCS